VRSVVFLLVLILVFSTRPISAQHQDLNQFPEGTHFAHTDLTKSNISITKDEYSYLLTYTAVTEFNVSYTGNLDQYEVNQTQILFPNGCGMAPSIYNLSVQPEITIDTGCLISAAVITERSFAEILSKVQDIVEIRIHLPLDNPIDHFNAEFGYGFYCNVEGVTCEMLNVTIDYPVSMTIENSFFSDVVDLSPYAYTQDSRIQISPDSPAISTQGGSLGWYDLTTWAYISCIVMIVPFIKRNREY